MKFLFGGMATRGAVANRLSAILLATPHMPNGCGVPLQSFARTSSFCES
ncbi:MAG: hypothetical protein IM606_04530 [Cytophagales bacterium]|nr:hypothetical protein [Cytophagales bacterium]MCA6392845.1 hypothetical protein [Cytophagales bacterium]MCA6394438.1 hypothetical protein [Cytophagales bacterium]